MHAAPQPHQGCMIRIWGSIRWGQDTYVLGEYAKGVCWIRADTCGSTLHAEASTTPYLELQVWFSARRASKGLCAGRYRFC